MSNMPWDEECQYVENSIKPALGLYRLYKREWANEFHSKYLQHQAP